MADLCTNSTYIVENLTLIWPFLHLIYIQSLLKVSHRIEKSQQYVWVKEGYNRPFNKFY